MKTDALVSALTGTLTAAAGAAAFAWWLSLPPSYAAAERRETPGDATGEGARGPAVRLEGSFRASGGTPSDLRGAWPRFRGANGDGVAADSGPIADSWPEGGPPVLWSLDLGEGHAGPAVRNGRVVVLDYDERAPDDCLRCLSLADGREIWRRTYAVRLKRNHGMSRTVPAVSDRFVVTLGPRCHVVCADVESGAFLWGLDLARDFGARVPLWYAGQCPLIDGETAVLAPGGKALLLGVDCRTGKILWETPNPRGWRMSHSSVMPMEFGGRRMFVYGAIGGIAGIAADGPDRGKVLWETSEWKPSVFAPSPVRLPGDRLLVTAGYGSGAMLFGVSRKDGRWSVESERRFDRKELACEQHTPVFYRDCLFTVLPKDAGPGHGLLVCADLNGRHHWTSGPADRFGLGPFLIADGKVLVLSEDGVLTMARADERAYAVLARAKVLWGRDSWAPMALADGRLLLRDSKRMICLDLRRP